MKWASATSLKSDGIVHVRIKIISRKDKRKSLNTKFAREQENLYTPEILKRFSINILIMIFKWLQRKVTSFS